MKYRIILLASFLGLLAACSQEVGSTPLPPPTQSLPTIVALTGQAIFATSDALTQTVLPTRTPVPTQTPAPTRSLPTPSPTIEPGFTKLAQIQFIAPGPMSSLVSPIKLQALVASGGSELVQYDLLGEDGLLLQRIVRKVQHFEKGSFQSLDLTFDIRAVSEAGYIRISTKDKLGRIQALNTMPVLLYSTGTSQINPIGNMIYERVMVEKLKEGDGVYGGTLNLKGLLWPFNDQPVIVDLFLPDGESLSSRIINPEGIDTQTFETSLPYKVTEPTLVRLTFRQDNPLLGIFDPELKRNIYVYSMQVVLNP